MKNKTAAIVLELVVVILVGAGMMPLVGADGTTVSIGSGSAEEGGTVVVPLMITDVSDLGSASLNLTFDASVVNVTAVTSSSFYFKPNLNIRGPGWVKLQAGQFTTGLGDAKLCDVTLHAIGNAGDTSPLNLKDVVLEDFTAQQPIAVDVIVNGTFTIGETMPPIVINPNADPIVIPDDTDGVPLWGENTTLAVNVTDDSAISEVTIDLSDIGGSPIANMSNIGNQSDGTLWCMFNRITNASAGTYNWNGAVYEPYCLQVNATDISGNFNISVCINVTVMKNGDVCPYDGDGEVDFTHDGLYLVRHTLNVPGYEVLH